MRPAAAAVGRGPCASACSRVHRRDTVLSMLRNTVSTTCGRVRAGPISELSAGGQVLKTGEQASLSAPTQCYGVRRVLTKLSVNLGLTIATMVESRVVS